MTDQAELEFDEGNESVKGHTQASGVVQPADGALNRRALLSQAAAVGMPRLVSRG